MSLPIITGRVLEHRRDLPDDGSIKWALIRFKLYRRHHDEWHRVELGDEEVKLFQDECTDKLYLVKKPERCRSRSRSPSPVPPPVVPDCIIAPNGSARLCATDAGNLDGVIANDFRIFLGPGPVVRAKAAAQAPGTITILDYNAKLGTLIVGNQCEPVVPTTFGRNSITVGTGGCGAAPSPDGPNQASTPDSAVFGDHSLVRAVAPPTPAAQPAPFSDAASSLAIGSLAWANIRNSFAQGFGDSDLQGGHQKVTAGLVGAAKETGTAVLGTIDNPDARITFPVPLGRGVDAVVRVSINGDIAVDVGNGCQSVPHIDALFYVSRDAAGNYYSCGLATRQIGQIIPGQAPFAPLVSTIPVVDTPPVGISPLPFDSPETVGAISFLGDTSGFTLGVDNTQLGDAAGQTYHAAVTYHSMVRAVAPPEPAPQPAAPVPGSTRRFMRFGAKH